MNADPNTDLGHPAAAGLDAAQMGQLRALAGAPHARAATDADSVLGVPPACVVEPGSEEEVAAVLRFADQEGLAVIPRGGGTKLEWGNPPRRADILLSLARLNRVLEHAWADLTVIAEAGCTIAALQRTLGEHGQRLAFDPLWPAQATIGGVLAANDSGALRLGYGGLRDLVIGATLALPDGTLAKSGGKVVKNVAGYDLCKLSTGALGTLGVVTRVILRVHPLPAGRRTLTFSTGNTDQMQQLILDLLASNLNAIAIQARASHNNSIDQGIAVDVGLEGSQAGLVAQEAQLQALAHAPSQASSRPLAVETGSEDVWGAREALFTGSSSEAVAKFTSLPTSIGSSLTRIAQGAEAHGAGWNAVIQATGIGWVKINPYEDRGHATAAGQTPAPLLELLKTLRAANEAKGGSFVLLRRPPELGSIDAWGNPGDALELMRSVKRQFDPGSILNPGRFAGGI